MNVFSALRYAVSLLKSKNVDSPLLDAELLLIFALKNTREYLLTHPEKIITNKQWLKFEKLTGRRARREPLAYIIGVKEFFGLKFLVDRRVLIPRPSTEKLVEEALEEIKKYAGQNILLLDIGTGTGAVPISVAKNINGKKYRVKIFTSDISPHALKIAKNNAKLNKVGEKIQFLRGDLLQPLVPYLKLRADKLIVAANLPYLKNSEWKNVWPEIKKYEPESALVAGKDGLKYYKKLLEQIYQIYSSTRSYRSDRSGGSRKSNESNGSYRTYKQIVCLFEINPEQKNSMKKLIHGYFPKANIKFKKDLSGVIRICEIHI